MNSSPTRPAVAIVAGARPNFMKIAPVLRAMQTQGAAFDPIVVHTGQHYSQELSDVFFQEFGIRPDVFLEAGSGTHGQQTARVLESFESFLLNSTRKIDAVMVVGDVNSTVAAGLAATKLHIPLIHLEAGLRSFDRAMPEEINRLATDTISDLLLVSEPAGEENLAHEGVAPDRIRYVGNVMIDTLVQQLQGIQDRPRPFNDPYALVTLHRPSNVDDAESLRRIVAFLTDTSERLIVVFPVHPRTKARLEEFGLLPEIEGNPRIRLYPPLGYSDNLNLMRHAAVVLTDSGGIQEETSFLGVPCLTVRENTERPSTVSVGTNTLIGTDFEKARRLLAEILSGSYKKGAPIRGWDGKAALRVVSEISRFVAARQGAAR